MASEAWAALSALGLGVCAAALLERLLPRKEGRRAGSLLVPLCLGLSLSLASLTLGAWLLGPGSFFKATVGWTALAAFLLGTAAFLWKLAFGFPLLLILSLAALSLGWLRWGWIALPEEAGLSATGPGRGSAVLRLSLLPREDASWEIRVERPIRGGDWEVAGSLSLPEGDAALVAYRMSFQPAWAVAGPREWLWAAGLQRAGAAALALPSAQTKAGAALSGARGWLMDPDEAGLRLPGLSLERILVDLPTLVPGRPATLVWAGGALWR